MPNRRTLGVRRRRKPVRRRVRKVRRRRPRKWVRKKRNIIQLPRQIIPKTAFVTHKFVRYIRIPSRLNGATPPVAVNSDLAMPPWGAVVSQNVYPNNTLMISCNDPLAPFNEEGTSNSSWPLPQTRAFLNVPAPNPQGPPGDQSQCLFDTRPLQGGGVPATGAQTGYQNEYSSFWRKMQTFYTRWTVVGSKAMIQFAPDTVYDRAYTNTPNKMCIFTLGVRNSRADLKTDTQPQDLCEQPGFTTKEWHARDQSFGRTWGLQMSKKWSAKRNMGLSKGNIINNGDIAGTSRCTYSKALHGFDSPNQANTSNPLTDEFAQHPHSQQFYCFTGNSLLTNNTEPGAYTPSEWPSGLLKVTMNYHTVWSSAQFSDNEVFPPPVQ